MNALGRRDALFALVLTLGACAHAAPPVVREVQPPATPPVAPIDADRDADGAFDDVDACPDNPEDCDGFDDVDGCPELDDDGDGVLDGCDRCQGTAGVAPDGCPARVEVLCELVPLPVAIDFARNGARVPSSERAVVEAVAATMRANPEVLRLEVRGRALADERQPDALARRRAEAVVRELVARGVDSARLEIRVVLPADDAPQAPRVDFEILDPPPERPAPPAAHTECPDIRPAGGTCAGPRD